jgi:RNA polymerase sigma-70 factor (ECF subfamily)
MGPDYVLAASPPILGVGRAVEQLVISLPPKERACVLLKDVFDYTLEAIAELVSSTVGGVKAALNRGRSKLAALPEPVRSRLIVSPELSRLLHLGIQDRGLAELHLAETSSSVYSFAGSA